MIIPLAIGTASLAFASALITFGFGDSMRQRVGIFGGGGGWFLLLSAGPFAALNRLIAWLIPGVARTRLAMFLGGIALTIAFVLLFLVWMRRDKDEQA